MQTHWNLRMKARFLSIGPIIDKFRLRLDEAYVVDLIPGLHLGFAGETALIASTLLCNFFLTLVAEAHHWQEKLPQSSDIGMISTPILMNFLLAFMYIFVIPLLIARLIIYSNIETIKVFMMLGAKPTRIANIFVTSFNRFMFSVSIKILMTVIIVCFLLSIFDSIFYDYITVRFTSVITLSILSVFVFDVISSLVIRAYCLAFAGSLQRPYPESAVSDNSPII